MTLLQNQSTGHWNILKPLEIARSHPSVVAYKGKIYAFGGGGPSFKSLNSVTCYNPTQNTWANCQDMPTHRSGTVAALMGDSIYVMGGGFKKPDGMFEFLTKVEIYHPETDTWSEGPDLTMPHDYPAVAVLDDIIYVLGGHHPDATQGGPKTDPGFNYCERLDLKKGKWEAIAPLAIPRFALSAVVMGGKIHAMGGVAFRPEGFDNFTTIEIYDPTTQEWSENKDLALPWPAAGLGSAVINGNMYVFGGYSDVDIHNRTAVLNPQTNEWQQVTSMPSPACAMGVTVCDGKIYTVGGWADDGRTPINKAFAFKP